MPSSRSRSRSRSPRRASKRSSKGSDTQSLRRRKRSRSTSTRKGQSLRIPRSPRLRSPAGDLIAGASAALEPPSDFDTDPLASDRGVCDTEGHDVSTWVHRPWVAYAQNIVAAFFILGCIFAYWKMERTSTTYGRVFGLLTTLCIAAAPVTHMLGGLRKHHGAWGAFMPFLGGMQFVVLQMMAWVLFGVSLFTAISHGLGWLKTRIPSDGLIIIAFASGMCSEFLMVLSLYKFNPKRGSLTRALSAALVLAMLSFGLLVAWEATKDEHDASAILGVISVVFIVIAVPMTHQVEGHRRFKEQWSFYQPFQGGRVFVYLQAVSWFLFGVTIFLALVAIWYTITTPYSPTSGVIIALGGGGLVSEFIMLYSLSYFIPPDSNVAEHVRRQAIAAHRTGNSVLYDFDKATRTALQEVIDFFSVVFWYNLHIGPLALWFGCAFGLPFQTAALSLGVMFIPYSVTYLSKSHLTGAREWPGFYSACRWSFDGIMRYFDTRIISEAKYEPDRQYVFGFHPHGIYPLTCMWLTHSTTWRRLFGNISRPKPLGAGVFFKGPWMRDIAMWLGGRSVSRESFNIALDQGHNVMLVPGGMAEMRYSHSGDDVEIVGHHAGFIRMAFKAGASVVPVYSFGEHRILDNVRVPAIQAFFEKRIGFPFPYFPFGIAGLPIPRQEPLRVVFGKPIHLKKTSSPTQAQVERVRVTYFAQLQAMHDRHKASCGYPDQVMDVIHQRRKNTWIHRAPSKTKQ